MLAREGAVVETRQARAVATWLLCAGVSWAALATGTVAYFVDTWKFVPAFALVSAGAAVLLLFGRVRFSRSDLAFPLLLLLPLGASLFPSIFWTRSHDIFYLAATRLGCVGVAAVVVLVARRPRRALWIGWCMAGLLAVLCVVGVLEFFGLVLLQLNGQWAAVSSLAFHPNIYGGLLLLLFPPAAAALWSLRPRLRRVLLPVLTLLTVLNMAACRSRAAMIGFAGALCVGVAVLLSASRGRDRRARMRRFLLPLCGSLVLLCLAAVLLPATREKLLKLDLRTNARWIPYGIALRIWTQSPRTVLFGNGLGSFGTLWPSFRSADFRALGGDLGWDAVHNEYLEILVDGGILGLALSAIVPVWLSLRALRLIRSVPSPGTRILGTGCALALLGFALDALFSTNARTSFLLLVASVDAAVLAAVGIRIRGARGKGGRARALPPGRRGSTAGAAFSLALLAALDILFGLRLSSEISLARATRQPRPQDGAALATRACTLAPRGLYPWYHRSRLALQAGDAVQCLAAAQEVERRVPHFKDTGLMAGLACILQGEWQDALERLEGYLARDRHDLKAQAYLLVVELVQGRMDAAMDDLRRLMRSDVARSRGALEMEVSFPPGESVRATREGTLVRIEVGEQAGRDAIEALLKPAASSLNVYLFRLHYLLGRIYGGAELLPLAVRHLGEARAHYLAAGSDSAEEDRRRFASLLSSLIGGFVALADESRSAGSSISEATYLTSYLALAEDGAARARLASLYRDLLDFKALRRLEAGVEAGEP